MEIEKNTSIPGERCVPKASGYLTVTIISIYIFTFFFGVVMNVVLLIVTLKTRKKSISLYIINLCVADLLVLVVCVPTTLVEFLMKDSWLFGETLCIAIPVLEFIVSSTSILNILLICTERFRVISNPLEAMPRPRRRVICSLSITWFASFVINSPIIAFTQFKDSRLIDGTPIKVCRIRIQSDFQKAYIVVHAILTYILPCAMLITIYILMIRNIKDARQSSPQIKSMQERHMYKNTIRSVYAVVIVFFICHLPYRVVGIWLIFENTTRIVDLGLEMYLIIVYASRLVFYINHSLNPILYSFVSSNVRKSVYTNIFRTHPTRKHYSVIKMIK